MGELRRIGKQPIEPPEFHRQPEEDRRRVILPCAGGFAGAARDQKRRNHSVRRARKHDFQVACDCKRIHQAPRIVGRAGRSCRRACEEFSARGPSTGGAARNSSKANSAAATPERDDETPPAEAHPHSPESRQRDNRRPHGARADEAHLPTIWSLPPRKGFYLSAHKTPGKT